MDRRTRDIALAAALLLSAAAFPEWARAQQWSLEAQAGRLRYDIGSAAAHSSGLALGLRYDDARSWLRLSTGVPLTPADPLWGAAGFWRRLALDRGPFLAGVDLAGHGYMQRHEKQELTGSDPFGLFERARTTSVLGFGLAGQAMPVLGYEGARVQLQARSGLSHYYRELGEEERGRTVRVSDLQLTLTPLRSFALTSELKHYGAEEGSYTFGGVSGYFAHARGSAWGSVGRWLGSDVGKTPWAAGASLRVAEGAELSFHARQDAFDPVYRSVPQTSWGVGLNLRLGGAPALPEPVPAAYVGGRATLLLPLSEAVERPLIAGDFNDWKPQPMVRAGESWSFTIALAPGVYNYSFVTDEGEWFVPDSVPGRKDDGMGGYVAVLVVS